MAPRSGIVIRQFGFAPGLSQVTAKADFFIVRHYASKRSSILEEHKRDVLIMGAVDAIGEITCRFRDADDGYFHKIRFSYVLQKRQGAHFRRNQSWRQFKGMWKSSQWVGYCDDHSKLPQSAATVGGTQHVTVTNGFLGLIGDEFATVTSRIAGRLISVLARKPHPVAFPAAVG